jgi:hypothetical protein
MALGPFETAAAEQIPTSIELAPALNGLNSLALLNRVGELPALDSWVTDTASQLSTDERGANQLLLDLLGGALIVEGDWPDFPSYLAALAEQPPELLRDRALAWLGRSAARSLLELEPLLADPQRFSAHVAERATDAPPDPALLREAHWLLNNPLALREAALGHLRAMWDRHLAVAWHQATKGLEAEMKGFAYHVRNYQQPTLDNLRAFIGGELVESVTAQGELVGRLVFVPSPHTGRHVTRLYLDGTLYLFFHAPRNFAVLWRQAPVGRNELVLRLTSLADETRLRILGLFAERDELTQQEIQERLGLTQPTASRQIKGLSPYLVERRAEGASKVYRLSPAQFDLTFRALKRLVSGADDDQDARRDQPGDLRRFMDRRGRFTQFPTRARDQLAVLEFIAEHFELGRQYTEREVNEVISRHLAYDDFATLRRELYDRMFLGRERDGSRYWRIDPEERAKHYAV